MFNICIYQPTKRPIHKQRVCFESIHFQCNYVNAVQINVHLISPRTKEYYLKRRALRSWKSKNNRLGYVYSPGLEMHFVMHCQIVFGSTSHVILASASVCDNIKVKQRNMNIGTIWKIETKLKLE